MDMNKLNIAFLIHACIGEHAKQDEAGVVGVLDETGLGTLACDHFHRSFFGSVGEAEGRWRS